MSSFPPLVHSVCVNGVQVGSASPGSLASGKFGVLYCSDFLRSLKEYFNFVCFFYYFYVHEYFACLYVWAFVPSEDKKELDL